MHPLRSARLAAGLSQHELADRANVSRQLIGTIEAERHEPGVGAALRLAAAVGSTVDALFGGAVSPEVEQIGVKALAGPLRIAQVGRRTVGTPITAADVMSGVVPDAVATSGEVTMLPGANPASLVLAGCEPALALALGLARVQGMVVPMPTPSAVEALRRGTAHIAAVHGHRSRFLKAGPDIARIRMTRWQVGVAVPHGGPRSIDELLDSETPIVRRHAGAASQTAFERLARRHGATPRWAATADGHAEAAQYTRLGSPAAITSEPAALAAEVGFLDVEAHEVELWCHRELLAYGPVSAFLDTIASPAFVRRLGLIAGYDVRHCGEMAA